MDHRSFDRLARLLGGETTRRAGLKAAIGGLLGLVALDHLELGLDADARERGAARHRAGAKGKGQGNGQAQAHRDRPARGNAGQRAGGPSVAGPCGPSRAANACRRNADCCTGLCNARRRGRNTDQLGRCRCVDRGRACSEDRNCCGGLRCHAGKCLAAPPSPRGCASDADCAANPTNKVCDPVSSSCVQCIADPSCSANPKKKVCDTSSNTCVQCTADANCSAESTRKTCDTDTSTCVQCTADANCSTESLKKVCNTDTNACVQCLLVADCSPGDCLDATSCTANACVTAAAADDTTCSTGQCKAGACVECTTNAGCSDEATDKVCKTSSNSCVQCLKDSDCDASAPACKSSDNTCASCTNLTYPYQWEGSPLHTPAGIAIDPTWAGKEIWVSNFAYGSTANDAKVGYMKNDGTGLTMGPSMNNGSSCQGLTLTSDRVPFCAGSTATNGKILSFDPTTLAVNTPVLDYNDSNFKLVYGIYIDGSSTSGTVWTSTTVGSGNSAVWKFRIGVDTSPTQVFSSLGNSARAIVPGPGGYLYIAVEDSNKVVVVDPAFSGTLPSSTFVATLNLGSDKPFGIAFDGNTMFLNDRANKKVTRYTIELDGSNVPQFTKVCDYTHTIADSFFFVFDPATNNIWTPSWGATRALDAVTAINISG